MTNIELESTFCNDHQGSQGDLSCFSFYLVGLLNVYVAAPLTKLKAKGESCGNVVR